MMPLRSRPAATTMPAPPKLALVLAEPRTRMPLPDLVRPTAPGVRAAALVVMRPLKVAVTPGVPTAIVRLSVPRLMAPERITPAPAVRPPKEKSPFTLTVLATVRTVPSLMSVVPLAMLRAPVPIGPLVMTLPASTELEPNISEPAERLSPLVKVLAPLKASMPEPALVSDRLPPLETIAEIVRPVSARPALTVMTGLVLLNCSAPLMTGVVTCDWLTEVTGLAEDSTRSVLVATVGAA